MTEEVQQREVQREEQVDGRGQRSLERYEQRYE